MKSNTLNKVILGENCLLEYQLYRTGIINQPHGCFDSMKIHIDSITQIVNDDFKGLLDKANLAFLNYMYYDDLVLTKWINNKYSGDIDNIFSWPVCCLFHLDSLEENKILTKEKYDSFQRKINRTKELFENDTPTLLFYYYRYSERYDLNTINNRMLDFLDLVKHKYNKDFYISLMIYQPKDDCCGKRDVKTKEINNNYIQSTFISDTSWVKSDDNWNGQCDNDLFEKYKTHLNKWINNKNLKL